MDAPRPRRRWPLILVIAILLLAGIGFGVRGILSRPEQRSVSKLCEQLALASSLSSSLVTLDPTTLGPQVAELQRAASVAPSDIQAQVGALASFVQELADAVRSSPTDKKDALTDALAARQDRIDQVTAAGQAVEAWSITNCGTPLRSTTTQQRR